jgi:hypothetical protein
MSTRATIACKRDDGRYAAIYLHFDGYPDRTGKILSTHYSDPNLVQTLVSEGDIRCFDNDGVPERFSDGKAPNIMPTHAALLTFASNCGTEYVYVFDDCEWHCHKL